MCGEHHSSSSATHCKLGSSPHVRGALADVVGCGRSRGIIPACAGSTPRTARCRRCVRDHPRMCGEHMGVKRVAKAFGGSSPHVRGAPYRLFNMSFAIWDHPRMCGEHSSLPAVPIPSSGSSPHVRGAPIRTGYWDGRAWDHPRMCGEHPSLTASCVLEKGSSPHVRGAPGCPVPPRWLIWDHPRMCGEHLYVQELTCEFWGSSPHVRGAPWSCAYQRPYLGIIPACAGSTPSPLPRLRGWRDHPRMCGEHSRSISYDAEVMGSSPHVRGARAPGEVLFGDYGIIPACAGSTRCAEAPFRTIWDHPRMCGEHNAIEFGSGRLLGSSPHVRGAPPLPILGTPLPRIIPACAGSTLGQPRR